MADVVKLASEELRVEAVRVQGQSSQENPRGVKITHIPTGISITRKTGRSRLENTEAALATLGAMVALEQEDRENEIDAIPTLSREAVDAAQRRLRDGSSRPRIVDEADDLDIPCQPPLVRSMDVFVRDQETVESEIAATRQRVHTAFDTAMDELHRLVGLERDLIHSIDART